MGGWDANRGFGSVSKHIQCKLNDYRPEASEGEMSTSTDNNK